MPQTTLILHNIRSVHNVGSIFRTANGLGINTIHLTGYTPTPIDRFGRKRNDFKKVSLGAEETIQWSHDTIDNIIQTYKHQNTPILALEQHPSSIPLHTYTPQEKQILIVGNETEGIDPGILAQCDTILEIPMHGTKESFNVSVATGIALYSLQN